MKMVYNIGDHMARSCACGSVNFALLMSGGVECNKCGCEQDMSWSYANRLPASYVVLEIVRAVHEYMRVVEDIIPASTFELNGALSNADSDLSVLLQFNDVSGHRLADERGVVINNNLKGSQVLVACPPHTTIPVGTVMIVCQHPDVIDDACVICGISIIPNSDDWRTALLSAGKGEL